MAALHKYFMLVVEKDWLTVGVWRQTPLCTFRVILTPSQSVNRYSESSLNIVVSSATLGSTTDNVTIFIVGWLTQRGRGPMASHHDVGGDGGLLEQPPYPMPWRLWRCHADRPLSLAGRNSWPSGGDRVSNQSPLCNGVVVTDTKKSRLLRACHRDPDPAWDLGVEGSEGVSVEGDF